MTRLLTFRRWGFEVEGKPGLIHIDPAKVVLINEEFRGFTWGVPTLVAIIHLEFPGGGQVFEVLDEDRTVAQEIQTAREEARGD